MSAALDDPTDGHLTRDKLQVLLAALCAQAGLDPHDAELIKFTNNAVFRLSTAAVIVRIAGSATMRARLSKVIQVARWLADSDIPAVRLLPDLEQPVAVDGHLATFWTEVPASGPPPTGADLAAILHRLHALPQPPFGLPPWKPTDEIRQRLAEPEGVDPDDLTFLLERCDHVDHDLSQLEYVLPAGPIHGDPFMGNLIPGPHGPVICDFDAACTGPREWDLTPVAVGKLRFDYPHDTHTELAASYGFDVTTWNGFPALRQVRELKLVTSVIPILRSNPSIHTQWRHRLQTFKAGDTAAKWSTYR
jgi:Ser/Thr protein kinase RdoA (MazF antagonist)